jgi:hypothetical protein
MTPAALCLIAVFVMGAVPAPAGAQKYEGVPVKSGQASFTFNGKDLAFSHVDGGFQQIQGFTMATVVFRPEAKSSANTHLNIVVMYQAPGRVDLDGAFSMNGISMFWDGEVSRFTKGKSKCTITLTKATATELEGTADCPLMHSIAGEVMPGLSRVTFSAGTR